MKIKFLIFIFVNISLFAQFGNPKIVPLEKSFDFGDIKEGEVVSHDFIVFNKGTNTLKIEKVKASCGCTAANPTKTELEPEDSTSIKVEFNSKHRRGVQRKFVYIFSNDPETPQLRLVFNANIITEDNTENSEDPTLKLSAYTHNFGTVNEGDILDLVLNVENIGKSMLEIKNVKSSCGCTAAMLSSKLLKPNQSGELKIEFDTKNLSGRVARTITLFSNDPKRPASVVTLTANIVKG